MKPTLISKDKIICGFFVIVLVFSAKLVFAGIDSNWESQFAEADTFWGMETNGVKVGLLINPLSCSTNVSIHCTPVIKSTRNQTNHLWIYFPPLESCFQMTLKDGSGKITPKTAKGKALGKPNTEPLMVKFGMNIQAGYKMRPIKQNYSEVLSDFSFVLQDYFEATNSGKYKLTYEMQVILPQRTNGKHTTLHTTNLLTLTLPPVVADVKIGTK